MTGYTPYISSAVVADAAVATSENGIGNGKRRRSPETTVAVGKEGPQQKKKKRGAAGVAPNNESKTMSSFAFFLLKFMMNKNI